MKLDGLTSWMIFPTLTGVPGKADTKSQHTAMYLVNADHVCPSPWQQAK